MPLLPPGLQAQGGLQILACSARITEAPTLCGFLRSGEPSSLISRYLGMLVELSIVTVPTAKFQCVLFAVSSAICSALAPPALDVADAQRQQQQQQQQMDDCSMQRRESQLLQPCWPSQQRRLQAVQPHVLHSCSSTTGACSGRTTALNNCLGNSRPLGFFTTVTAAAEQQVGHVLIKQPHQLQQQQGLKQLRSFDEAPKPLPRFRKPSKDGRMNRMVIRVPPQVQLELRDQQLVITGVFMRVQLHHNYKT